MQPDDQAKTFEINTHGKAGRTVGPGYLLSGVYLIKAKLGQGGMGCVFSAEHQLLKKDVAVKLIFLDQINEQSWRRFELEGRTIAKMEHPAIVKIYDMAISDDCPFYAMDLLDGIPLSELTQQKKVTPQEIFEIFKSLAEGFAYAHGKGVIHRDIKPSNVMLVANGKGALMPKILDFGIAKLTDKSSAQSQSQTKTGLIVGSPLYMSPEQAQGEMCDERSDIYSLGCTLFEILSGHPPFKGASAMQTMMMHQEAAVPRIGRDFYGGEVPPGTDTLLAKMLAKNKGQRYQSMTQVVHDLERLIAGRPVGAASQQTIEQGESIDGMPALSSSGGSRWMIPAAASLATIIIGCGAIAYYFSSGAHKHTAPRPVPNKTRVDRSDIDYAPPLPAEENFKGANFYKDNSLNYSEVLHPLQSKEIKELMAVKEIRVLRKYGGNPMAIAFQFPQVEIGRVGNAAQIVAARGFVVRKLDHRIGFAMTALDHAPAVFYPHVVSLLPRDTFSFIDLCGPKETVMVKSKFSDEDTALVPQKFGEILKIAATWPSLRNIMLENISMKAVDLGTILSPCKMLERIELRAVSDIEDESLSKSTALRTLISFVAVGGTVAPKTLCAIADNGHLITVNLNGQSLTAQVADALAQSPKLSSIELHEKFNVDATIIERLSASKSLVQVALLDAPLRPEMLISLAKIKRKWKLVVRRDPCNESVVASLSTQNVQFENGE